MAFSVALISSPCPGTLIEPRLPSPVPYAVLEVLATVGRGFEEAAEPALRERRIDGVGGMSVSTITGDTPLLEAALLVARVVRLVDMLYERGCN